jgi:hypothetical protein
MSPRRGSARVAHGPVFVFRVSDLAVSCFIVHSTRIGLWTYLERGLAVEYRAVGRAYVREIVHNSWVLVLGGGWWVVCGVLCYGLYRLYRTQSTELQSAM